MTLIGKLFLIVSFVFTACQIAQAQTCPSNPYALTNGTTADASQVMANFNNLLSCLNSQPGLVFPPAGRLTLTSGTPVLTSNVSAAGTVYYTPYNGNLAPVWTGTGFVATIFSEVSNILANSATGNAGPAAAGASSVYDLFVWSNAGAITLTRGPLWTNGTARSSGTALTRVNGILTNAVAITNGPAAGSGTYVGTFKTNASGTVDYIFGSAASGGSAASFGVWNYYNRVLTQTAVTDNGTPYTYVTNSWRAARGSTSNMVSFIIGFPEDFISAQYRQRIDTAPVLHATQYYGLGFDTANGAAADAFIDAPAAAVFSFKTTVTSTYAPVLGEHFIQAGEFGDGGNLNTIDLDQDATLYVQLRN